MTETVSFYDMDYWYESVTSGTCAPNLADFGLSRLSSDIMSFGENEKYRYVYDELSQMVYFYSKRDKSRNWANVTQSCMSRAEFTQMVQDGLVDTFADNATESDFWGDWDESNKAYYYDIQHYDRNAGMANLLDISGRIGLTTAYLCEWDKVTEMWDNTGKKCETAEMSTFAAYREIRAHLGYDWTYSPVIY
jgi:hypothetical protein